MNNLLDRGLIECEGRLDAPGRPMLYGTTPDFLRAFGLSSIDALPQTAEEIKAMFARLDNEEETADVDDAQISFTEEQLEVVATEESTEITTIEETSYEDEVSAEDDVVIDM
jgi:hypothetical protein